VILGVLVAISGLTGTLLSGYLSDRWTSRGVPAARFRVTLVAWSIIIPGTALWPLMPSPALSYAFLAIAIFGTSLGQAAAPPSIQDVVPNSMRGQAIAVYLLIGGLLGIGLGPTSIALVTDRVYGNEAMLPYALVTVAAPAALLGLWLCWSGQAVYSRTLAVVTGRPDPINFRSEESPR
jgi:MFS family permease